LTRVESEGDRRMAALEQQVNRLLDFQTAATQAMLERRAPPTPSYSRRVRSRTSSRSSSPRRYDDTA
jgi:hypothetical protein